MPNEIDHTLRIQAGETFREEVLSDQISAEHAGIIRRESDGDSGVKERGEGVLLDFGHRAGADVRGRTHLEGDPLLGEMRQQFRILCRGDAMTDALSVEVTQRRPNGLGPRGFSRMRETVQAQVTCPSEMGGEERSGNTNFRAPETEADGRLRRIPLEPLDRPIGDWNPQPSMYIENPSEFNPTSTREGSTMVEGFTEFIGFDAIGELSCRSDRHFGVADPLLRQVPSETIDENRDVLSRGDQSAHGLVDLDEGVEIAESEEILEVSEFGRHPGLRMTTGEFENSQRGCGPDEVQVQLDLG